MERERISELNELKLNNEHVEKFILFDGKTDYGDLAFIFNDFGFDKAKFECGIKLYRDLGLVFRMAQHDPEHLDDWSEFISEVIPVKEDFNKLDNIFASKDCKRILMVTNQRLMRHDLARLNRKINEMNIKIAIHNAPLTRKPTLKERIIQLFR